MAYLSKRRRREPEDEETGELNIVPYLDVLMNLIMFMLLSITGLATFGMINVSAPNYGTGAATKVSQPEDKPQLLLTVLISKKGFYVASTGVVLGQGQEGQPRPADGTPTVPKKPDGTYDYAALSAQMVQVKNAVPSETKVIIGAESDVPYEILVQTMDAVREAPTADHRPLFPDVTLAAM